MLAQIRQQTARFLGIEPMAQEFQGFTGGVGQRFEGKQQVQPTFTSLLITWI